VSRRRISFPIEPVQARIESLSHEGRGIARIDGKTVFIEGALPGETVRFRYVSRHPRYDEGIAVEVLDSSDQRTGAGCPHFSVCGGCSLQHMSHSLQIQHKERVLLEQLEHMGEVQPSVVLPAIAGPLWGYRRKARLGVKYVAKKNRVLVGFREKRKPFIADLDACPVLHPAAGNLLSALKDLIGSLSIYNRIPQIEVAAGDKQTVLVIRHLDELSREDRAKLHCFENSHAIRFFLQGNKSESIVPLSKEDLPGTGYAIESHNIQIDFDPLDFTQVNFSVNRRMLDRVIELLHPGKDDRILDLFCGVGNFTLPLARHAGHVTGVDGSAGLVKRAEANAVNNNLPNAGFQQADLYGQDLQAPFLSARYDKVLLDPPRSGAREIIERMDLQDVCRLVYVSCNPPTLSRDAGILVHLKGFRFESAGVIDMFPHTAHVESVALFVKDRVRPYE